MPKKALIALIALFILLSAGAGFWQWKNWQKIEKEKQFALERKQEEEKGQAQERNDGIEGLINSIQEVELPRINTDDWKIYKNESYGFEMRIPIDWYVESVDENKFCLKSKSKKFYFEGERDVCGIFIDTDYIKTYSVNEEDLVKSLKELHKRKTITEIGRIYIDNKRGLYFVGLVMPTVLTKNISSLWEIKIQAAESHLEQNNVKDIFYGIIQTFHFVN